MANLVSPGLSLSAAVSWGAADFSGGVASKEISAFSVVVLAHGIGLFLMFSLALITKEVIPGVPSLFWALAAGLVGGVGIVAFYKALAIGKMGINAPLSAVITALLPVVFSFKTEGLPHALQFIGLAIALISIWLIAAQPGATRRTEGLGLAVVAGVGFSGFLLFIKLAGSTSVFWPLTFARIASSLLMLIVILLSGSDWKPTRRSLPYILLAGILDSGANALYVAATQRGRLDVAAVLSSLYPATTVILARVLLHERLSRVQSAGMVAAVIAVPLIAVK